VGSKGALAAGSSAHVVRLWARLRFVNLAWFGFSVAWIELICGGNLVCMPLMSIFE
jgi:hypothetical protein